MCISYSIYICFRLPGKQAVGRAVRLYATDALKYPKITTHYSVHPRDKDARWTGNKMSLVPMGT